MKKKGDATTYGRFSFDYVEDLNKHIANSESLVEKKIIFTNLGEDAMHTYAMLEKLEKTPEYLNNLKTEYKNKEVGYISLMFGTTDVLAQNPILEGYYDQEFINRNRFGYKKHMEKIIEILSGAFPKAKFLILSIPVVGEDIVDISPLAYNEDEGLDLKLEGVSFAKEEIERMNKEEKELAAKTGPAVANEAMTANEVLVHYNRVLQKIVKDSNGKCIYLPVFEKLQTKLKKQKELVEKQKAGKTAAKGDVQLSFAPFSPDSKVQPFLQIGVSWFLRYVMKWQWTDIGKRNQYLLTTDQVHLNEEGGKIVSDLIIMFFALED